MSNRGRGFAADTKVPVEQSRLELERTLKRYGADRFAYFSEDERVIILFEAHERRIKFELPLPKGKSAREEKESRRRWRALLLCIKAKLESIESKIETFEEAFLAHVVMGDGKTVHEHARDRIALAYSGGEVQALLPPPKGAAA